MINKTPPQEIIKSIPIGDFPIMDPRRHYGISLLPEDDKTMAISHTSVLNSRISRLTARGTMARHIGASVGYSDNDGFMLQHHKLYGVRRILSKVSPTEIKVEKFIEGLLKEAADNVLRKYSSDELGNVHSFLRKAQYGEADKNLGAKDSLTFYKYISTSPVDEGRLTAISRSTNFYNDNPQMKARASLNDERVMLTLGYTHKELKKKFADFLLHSLESRDVEQEYDYNKHMMVPDMNRLVVAQDILTGETHSFLRGNRDMIGAILSTRC